MPQGCKPPLDQNTINKYYEYALSDTKGGSVFILGYEAVGYFMIPPGDYVILVFTDDPDVIKDSALVAASRSRLSLQHM